MGSSPPDCIAVAFSGKLAPGSGERLGHQYGRKASTMSDDGLITIGSRFAVKESIDRLAAMVTSKGMTVFGRVDHAANAAQVNMSLRPTELVIFGNAKGGTPLMQAVQSIGIDLPLKALAWEDADGKVWITTNDPAWLARRHGLGDDVASNVAALAAGLAAVTGAAAGA